MRNRLLPLGYRTENGKTVIDKREAEIVKSIFNEYCNGKSLKALVNSLNERDALFKENGTKWNKGRIHHILVDRRYVGEKSFPIIIDVAIFDKANSLKDDKRVYKTQITAETERLKSKVFCNKCGAKYIRIMDSDKKERWVCSAGCRIGRRPTDEKLTYAVNAIVKKVFYHPELLIQPMEDAGYKRTTEIMRLTNEIARMNEQSLPSFNMSKTLLFQIAASKFSACKEDKSVYTDYVTEQVRNAVNRDGVDVELIENAIYKVLVIGKNEFAIKFVNGAIITNKEETNSASETCNEDRRESVVV